MMCHAKPFRSVALLLALALGGSVTAWPADPAASAADPAGPLAAWMAGISAMQRLPVAGIQMVQSGEQVFFVSGNGRYAFLGPAYDLWHGRPLTSIEEAARLMARLDRTRLALAAEDLGALDLGADGAEVLVFVDPLCPACAALLDRLPALVQNAPPAYRFRLIPLPVLGADSQRAALALACLAERDRDAALSALLAQESATLASATGSCGQGPIQRALVTAHLLGIERVPFLIAPDGRLHAGAPEDLSAWLAGEEGA